MNIEVSTAPAGHFAFGENWSKFADLIDNVKVDQAIQGFQRLLGDAIAGKSVIDIGCGSGIHALAALKLGAARVLAIDVDPRSVETARGLLAERAPGKAWECRRQSVFDLDPETTGRFDIVYSWGVLHHTGAMYEAIAKAAALANPGGILCLALYDKTPLCGFWRLEKKIYSGAPSFVQSLMRRAYLLHFRFFMTLGAIRHGGERFSMRRFKSDYHKNRGMDFAVDIHDWLGGYPYESATPAEVDRFLIRLDFVPTKQIVTASGKGILGSGCNEFVFRRSIRTASMPSS